MPRRAGHVAERSVGETLEHRLRPDNPNELSLLEGLTDHRVGRQGRVEPAHQARWKLRSAEFGQALRAAALHQLDDIPIVARPAGELERRNDLELRARTRARPGV